MKGDNISISFLAVGIVFIAGCSPMTSSGIPKALNNDTLLQFAGKSQGVTINGVASGGSWDDISNETERRFSITLSSGSVGQLIAAYRREVERTITSMRGAINGTGITGSEDSLENFSYEYNWHGNKGIVRVYSFAGTNGEAEVVCFAYEHIKP